jgi:hypothetical protein
LEEFDKCENMMTAAAPTEGQILALDHQTLASGIRGQTNEATAKI